MNAGPIRDKLCDYIRVADDKFLSQLEKEYELWDSGKDKGHSLSDIKAEIATRKAKKHGR
jgi:hypothetical protein